MNFLSDTHCHLNLQEFSADFEGVISRASACGVERILVPGIDLKTSLKAVELSRKYPDFIYAAVGIHPNHSNRVNETDIIALEALAGEKSVVAIGEIGLDFFRDKASEKDQTAILKKMLGISKKVGKPICIHNRNADDKIINLLDTWHYDLEKTGSQLFNKPGVFHSFSGSTKILKWALAHHFFLGISGPVTFSKSFELQEIIKDIDISHLVIETDAPYLSPYPFRGKRNEPGNVRLMSNKIAELKQMTPDEVMASTSNNAKHLFNWTGV